ncbi:MAG: MGMT family protein [Candidatus Wildermuthbacteria bacterium]|nr:MGMT family protein [Candidatus Wildermuthbacteria bacterium]
MEDTQPQKGEVFKKIREIVKKIPQGKVMTYGDVARIAGTRDSRLVGWALRGNQDPAIPCHRVVRSYGVLAPRYSLGTWKGQKERLAKEGIQFAKEDQVDMAKHHWFRHRQGM